MKKILIIWAAAAMLVGCGEDPTSGGEPTLPEASISIPTQELNFDADGELIEGVNELTVTSSDNWRLTGRKSWCTPSAVEGKSGDKVSFQAQENTTEIARSVTYTFFCGDKTTRMVINQLPTRIFELEDDLWDIPAEGSPKVKIRLESTDNITAQIEESATGWILPYGTRAQLSYLYYTIPANDSYAARTGHVTVRCGDLEPRTITINQVKNNAIKPEKDTYKLEENSSELIISVSSNIPYEVQIPEDAAAWLTLRSQPTDSEVWGVQNLSFDIVGGQYRATAIKLVAKDGSLTIPLAIQLGEQKSFQVPDKALREDLIKLGYIVATGDGFTVTAAGLGATKIDLYKLYAVGGCFSAEGIENFPNLTTIDARFSRLRSLDLSFNTKITDLNTFTPIGIESLKLPAGITTIAFAARMYDHYSGSSSLSRYFSQSFKVESTGLTTIDVSGNRLQTIDVSGCPMLTKLTCTQASGYTLQSITLSESHRGKVTIDFADATLIYK